MTNPHSIRATLRLKSNNKILNAIYIRETDSLHVYESFDFSRKNSSSTSSDENENNSFDQHQHVSFLPHLQLLKTVDSVSGGDDLISDPLKCCSISPDARAVIVGGWSDNIYVYYINEDVSRIISVTGSAGGKRTHGSSYFCSFLNSYQFANKSTENENFDEHFYYSIFTTEEKGEIIYQSIPKEAPPPPSKKKNEEEGKQKQKQKKKKSKNKNNSEEEEKETNKNFYSRSSITYSIEHAIIKREKEEEKAEEEKDGDDDDYDYNGMTLWQVSSFNNQNSLDPRLSLAAGDNGTLHLYRNNTLEHVAAADRTILAGNTAAITACCFSPSTKYIVGCNEDGYTNVFLNCYVSKTETQSNNNSYRNDQLQPFDPYASSSSTTTTTTEEEKCLTLKQKDAVYAICFYPSSSSILLTAGQSGKISFWKFFDDNENDNNKPFTEIKEAAIYFGEPIWQMHFQHFSYDLSNKNNNNDNNNNNSHGRDILVASGESTFARRSRYETLGRVGFFDISCCNLSSKKQMKFNQKEMQQEQLQEEMNKKDKLSLFFSDEKQREIFFGKIKDPNSNDKFIDSMFSEKSKCNLRNSVNCSGTMMYDTPSLLWCSSFPYQESGKISCNSSSGSSSTSSSSSTSCNDESRCFTHSIMASSNQDGQIQLFNVAFGTRRSLKQEQQEQQQQERRNEKEANQEEENKFEDFWKILLNEDDQKGGNQQTKKVVENVSKRFSYFKNNIVKKKFEKLQQVQKNKEQIELSAITGSHASGDEDDNNDYEDEEENETETSTSNQQTNNKSVDISEIKFLLQEEKSSDEDENVIIKLVVKNSNGEEIVFLVC